MDCLVTLLDLRIASPGDSLGHGHDVRVDLIILDHCKLTLNQLRIGLKVVNLPLIQGLTGEELSEFLGISNFMMRIKPHKVILKVSDAIFDEPRVILLGVIVQAEVLVWQRGQQVFSVHSVLQEVVEGLEVREPPRHLKGVHRIDTVGGLLGAWGVTIAACLLLLVSLLASLV